MTETTKTAVRAGGGEEILARILEASRQAAAATQEQAERKAAARLDEERAAIAAQDEADRAAEQVQAERQLRAAQSAAALSVRNARLARRREEIDRTLQETLAHLRALPDEAYFALLGRLAAAHREGEGGELLLSAADLRRAPADFAASLGVTLCQTPAAIDGGCILRWGDIEENLTFEALLEERRDEMEDVICRELWGD